MMKFMRVNMTTGRIAIEALPDEYAQLGGRCLTSVMISDGVPAGCHPLGPENSLIFAPGFLTGSPLVNTGRLSIGAKSPLTGGIKESNVGGTMASALAGLGIRAVIVEGRAPAGRLLLLKIDGEGCGELLDAAGYKTMRTYTLTEKLAQDLDGENSVCCIGPAGEYLLKSASIQVTDVDGKPCRAAGRGGLGAVMGAKGLKALVVAKGGKAATPPADPAGFKETAKRFAQAVTGDGWSGKVLPQLGTANLVAGINGMGALPTRNARKGSFEGAEKISGETLAATIAERGGKTTHRGCSRCVIHCSNVYVDPEGGYVTAGLEYETIWSMGAMIGNDDLDAVARLDFLCDDIGLDTMNTGVAVAVAMDSGYRPFGDSAAAIEMVEAVGQASEIGMIIGNGPAAVGEFFGHHRVPAVKGQSIAAYDPRAMQGMGVTYATSPMGADHTAGFVMANLAPEGLVAASRSAQVHMAAVDSMGLCMFAQSGGLSNLFSAIAAATGKPYGEGQWNALGLRCIQAELSFNRRAGLTEEDNRLPKMFYEEPLEPHGLTMDVTDEHMDTVFPIGGSRK